MTVAVPLAQRIDVVPSVPWAQVTAAPGAALTRVIGDMATFAMYGIADWLVMTWATPGADVGALVTARPGLVERLLVGSGLGFGARVNEGLSVLPAGTHPVQVGAVAMGGPGASTLGVLSVGSSTDMYNGSLPRGAGIRPGSSTNEPWASSITGTRRTYACGAGASSSTGYGDNGANGIVIARITLSLSPPLSLSLSLSLSVLRSAARVRGSDRLHPRLHRRIGGDCRAKHSLFGCGAEELAEGIFHRRPAHRAVHSALRPPQP